MTLEAFSFNFRDEKFKHEIRRSRELCGDRYELNRASMQKRFSKTTYRTGGVGHGRMSRPPSFLTYLCKRGGHRLPRVNISRLGGRRQFGACCNPNIGLSLLGLSPSGHRESRDLLRPDFVCFETDLCKQIFFPKYPNVTVRGWDLWMASTRRLAVSSWCSVARSCNSTCETGQAVKQGFF